MMSLEDRREIDGPPSGGGVGHYGNGGGVDISQRYSTRVEPAHSAIGRGDVAGGDAYSVETYSTLDGASARSSSSEDDGGSVRSDHARDYYEGHDCFTDDGGGAGASDDDIRSYPRNGYDGGDDDDVVSEASSIRSLGSCEIIATFRGSLPGGGDEAHRASYQSYHSQQSYHDDERSDYCSDASSGEDTLLTDDESLGFPPGHVTRLDELNELQNHDGDDPRDKNSVNPSIIPSYFFCPITKMIMRDPVITPDGHTFERRAVLRSLILEPVEPISKNPLEHEELVEDHLVKQAIDKARKEAWIRYVVEFKDDDVDKVIEHEKILGESAHRVAVMEEGESDRDRYHADALPLSQSPPRRLRTPSKYDIPNHPGRDAKSPDASPTTVDNSPPAAVDGGDAANHGWSVPLGVHRITCGPPGLIVTADVHRRSTVVKRKIIKKSIVEDGSSPPKGTRKGDGGGGGGSKKKMKMRKGGSRKKKARRKNLKTTTSVVTRNLVLPPGSHVEILETRVHGGRVRGRIVWEEEVATEADHELSLLLEEEEVRKRAMAPPPKNPRGGNGGGDGRGGPGAAIKGKSRMFFRRKSSASDGGLPFTSELFDRPPRHSPAGGRPSRSPSPLATIEYPGWISLQWAGTIDNFERDEVVRRRRSGAGDARASLVSDEDEGPWSQPLPLGVYRVTGDSAAVGKNGRGQDLGSSTKQLPLYDAPDSESNIVDFLVCNQCLEVVETQVSLMKRKDNRDRILSNTEGKHVVRARCMVPVILSPLSVENFVGGNEFAPVVPQRKFRSGWITISEGKKSVTASPIPVGAYIVTTKDPLLSCDSNSKIKSILPSGSCMEVDATRIEFEEKEEMMQCRHCSRESMYHTVAVRALIASGGYVTLFVVSVGVSGTHGSLCACGRLVQQTYAEPVPLGMYRLTRSTLLTRGSVHKTQAIAHLEMNAFVRVMETRVEGGCVRGRVYVNFSGGNVPGQEGDSRRTESLVGWVSLFEPPSFSWAELVSEVAT